MTIPCKLYVKQGIGKDQKLVAAAVDMEDGKGVSVEVDVFSMEYK